MTSLENPPWRNRPQRMNVPPASLQPDGSYQANVPCDNVDDQHPYGPLPLAETVICHDFPSNKPGDREPFWLKRNPWDCYPRALHFLCVRCAEVHSGMREPEDPYALVWKGEP